MKGGDFKMSKKFFVWQGRELKFVGTESKAVEYYQEQNDDGTYAFVIEDEHGKEYIIEHDGKLVRA